MAIDGFTGTLSFPLVRGVLPRGPVWRPAPYFSGLRSTGETRSTISRPIYHPTEYGRGVIRNTVKRKGEPLNVPLRRLVRCIRERDGRVVRATWSDPTTGAYVFDQLITTERYTVLAYDFEHNYRAAVADNLEAIVE